MPFPGPDLGRFSWSRLYYFAGFSVHPSLPAIRKLQKKIGNPSLFSSAQASREQARKLRRAAQEGRAIAEQTIARARRLRARVHQLDRKLEEANAEVKRHRTLRDDALDALKQSLRDLESVRIVLTEDKGLHKLKTEIRKMIDRAR